MNDTETHTDEAEKKPVLAPAEKPFSGRLYGGDTPLYRTAHEIANMGTATTQPREGFSQSPGLREIENSQVPALAGGGMVAHVHGPQQAPVDPIAAGLDTQHNPMTRAENRAITLTGTLASGNPPTTYAHVGGQPVPQAAPATHETVAAPRDADTSTGPAAPAASAPITPAA